MLQKKKINYLKKNSELKYNKTNNQSFAEVLYKPIPQANVKGYQRSLLQRKMKMTKLHDY